MHYTSYQKKKKHAIHYIYLSYSLFLLNLIVSFECEEFTYIIGGIHHLKLWDSLFVYKQNILLSVLRVLNSLQKISYTFFRYIKRIFFVTKSLGWAFEAHQGQGRPHGSLSTYWGPHISSSGSWTCREWANSLPIVRTFII